MMTTVRTRVAFVVLGAVQVTLIAGITALSVALPAIQHDLGLTAAEAALVSSAYGLAFAGLLLLGGRIADLYGHRRVLVVGIALFAAASVTVMVADNLAVLLAARFVQGTGAAGAAPAAMALLHNVFPNPYERDRALAVWGGLAGIGATFGILLSGVVTTLLSWRWVLSLPVLVATTTAVAVLLVVPSGVPAVRTRLDVPGAVLATASLSLISVGLLETTWLPTTLGVVALVALVLVERKRAAPLLPRSLLSSPRRWSALGAILTAAGVMASTMFMLSLYFQEVRGFTPLWTAVAFLPFGVVQIVVGAFAGTVVERFGTRAVTTSGLLLAAGGALVLTRIDESSPYLGLPLAGLVALACGVAFAFAGAMVTAVAHVPAHQSGTAAGMANTAMEVGPSLGFAVLVTVALGHATPDVVHGYTVAFGVAATALAVVALLVGTTSRSTKSHTEPGDTL
jgi:MFS family permease